MRCITSVEIFQDVKCSLVDMKVVYTFNQSDHISKMRVDVDDIVDGKHNWEEKTREIADIRM